MVQAKDETQKELEKEAKRLLRNIKRRVKSAQKRGYSFSTDYVPNLPKKVTEGTIRRLKKYTPEYQAKHSVYVSPTGVEISGTERKKQEYTERSKKAAETRKRHYKEAETRKAISDEPAPVAKVLFMTIEDLIWQISFSWYDRVQLWTHNKGKQSLEYFKTRDANYMIGALEQAIADSGEEAVLTRINNSATRIYEIIEMVLLGSGNKYYLESRDGEVNAKVQEFAEIVKGAPLTASENLYLTDLAESQQNFIVS